MFFRERYWKKLSVVFLTSNIQHDIFNSFLWSGVGAWVLIKRRPVLKIRNHDSVCGPKYFKSLYSFFFFFYFSLRNISMCSVNFNLLIFSSACLFMKKGFLCKALIWKRKMNISYKLHGIKSLWFVVLFKVKRLPSSFSFNLYWKQLQSISIQNCTCI
jgi:sensor histidine kinase YesM